MWRAVVSACVRFHQRSVYSAIKEKSMFTVPIIKINLAKKERYIRKLMFFSSSRNCDPYTYACKNMEEE